MSNIVTIENLEKSYSNGNEKLIKIKSLTIERFGSNL